MKEERRYFVYITQSASRRAIYIGITNSLDRRVLQHRNARGSQFAEDYRAFRLIYHEVFHDVRSAIRREKQLKGWRREKKLTLVAKMNPQFRDLAAGWGEPIELLEPF